MYLYLSQHKYEIHSRAVSCWIFVGISAGYLAADRVWTDCLSGTKHSSKHDSEQLPIHQPVSNFKNITLAILKISRRKLSEEKLGFRYCRLSYYLWVWRLGQDLGWCWWCRWNGGRLKDDRDHHKILLYNPWMIQFLARNCCPLLTQPLSCYLSSEERIQIKKSVITHLSSVPSLAIYVLQSVNL